MLHLEELSRYLFLELVELKEKKERVEYSKTIQGKFWDLLGHLWSLYGIWKVCCLLLREKGQVVICTINVVFDRVGRVDPVTRGMEIAIHHLGLEFDVRYWSQQLSFALIAVMAVLSVRGLLITLAKFFHALSSARSSHVVVLLLAEIMGSCFQFRRFFRNALRLGGSADAREHAPRVPFHGLGDATGRAVHVLPSLV